MSDSEEEKEEVIPMPKNKVRFSDMPQVLLEKAIRICHDANGRFDMDKEVATEIKKMIAADAELGDDQAGWHVIVGKSFAASITYFTKYMIFFDLMDGCPKSFMLFKTV